MAIFLGGGRGGGINRPRPLPLDPPQRGRRPTPQPPSDDKETQRRIAEGQAWDKWQAWVNCNTPIMNKYNAQLHDFHKIGGTAFWWEVGAGFGVFAALIDPGDGGPMEKGPPVVGAWAAVLIVAGVHSLERKTVNDIISNYKAEVTKECGPKPAHP